MDIMDELGSLLNDKSTPLDRVIQRRNQKEQDVIDAAFKNVEALDRIHKANERRLQPDAQVGALGTDSDTVRLGVGGAMSGTGSVLAAPGWILDQAGQLIESGLMAAGLEDQVRAVNQKFVDWGISAPSEAFKGVGGWLKEGGQELQKAVDASTQYSFDQSTPTGDITDTSSWSLGENPSLEGYGLQLTKILGEFAPQAAGLVARSPEKAMQIMGAIGGLQAGEGQASDTVDAIMQMDEATLTEASDLYRELREDTPELTHEQAQQEVARTAGAASFMGGALVGTAGGAATGYILKPLQGKLQGNVLGRATKSVGLSAGEEALQEVGETVTGRAASNLAAGMDRDLTEGTFGDAVLGGSFGGGLGALGTTADEVGRIAEKVSAAMPQTDFSTKEKDIVAAAESGNIDKFLDPEDKKNYSPLNALGAMVIRARRDDVPEAEKRELKASMQNMITTLEQDAVKLQRQIDQHLPETIESTRQKLQTREQKLATAETEQERVQLRDDIEFLKESLDAIENVDPKRIKAMEAELKGINSQISEAQAMFSQVPGAEATADDVDALKATAGITPTDAPVSSTERTQAAKELTIVAMQNPDLLSTQDVETLVGDDTNGLSEDDRQFLRTLSQAQLAANLAQDMTGARRGVMQGTDGFIGIRQYQARMANAVRAKNDTVAKAQLTGLRKFRESHEAKANVFEKALEQTNKTGKPVIVARGKGHTDWKITQRKSLTDTFRNFGAIRIRPDSTRLVATVAQEREALKAAEAMLNAAYTLGFSQNASVTEQPEAVSDTPESTESPVAEETVNESEQSEAPEPESVEATPETSEAEPEPTQAAEPVAEPTLRERVEQPESGTDGEVEAELEPVNPEPESEVPTEAGEVRYEEGTLAVFKQKAAAITGKLTDEAFRKLNLVRQYFTQTSKKDSDVTERPLVVQKDFLSALIQDESVADLFVDARRYGSFDGSGLSEAQYAAIRDFASKAKDWNEYLETELINYDIKEQFYYRDLFHHLRDGQPTEENIKTAISYAAYSWLIDNASRPALATDEEINTILHRRPEHEVIDTERAEFGYIGTSDKLVINTLGQKVVQALGIRGTKDTPANLVSQLESSLGVYAMQLLAEQELVERHQVTSASFSREPGDADDATISGDYVTHPFVRLARKENLKPVDVIEAIGVANRNTQSILSHLMGVESGSFEPEFVEPEFNQAFTKGTKQRVPKRQQKIEAKKGKYAYQVRSTMFGLWDALDLGTKRTIVGVKDLDNKAVHKVNKLSAEGFNEGLDREIFLFDEFASKEEHRNRPFWLIGNIWKQQRVGLKSNTINPQASKIHRFLVSMTGWKVSVDTRLDSPSNRMFRLNVATGLGIKTDKQAVETSLKRLDEKLNDNPILLDAVEVIKQNLLGEPLSEAEQATLVEAVRVGGEAMHTMDALLGLAQWELAVDNGESSFETDMMLEIDGVTNGPMLAQLQLGAAPSAGELNEILNKGGMYELGSDYTNFNTWKEEAKQPDLYETLAKDIAEAMQAVIQGADAWKAQNFVSLNRFMDGLFDANSKKVTIGRNAVKTPLTAMVFGSSINNAIKSMAEEFVQGIYDRIEADANLPEGERSAATKETLKHINALLKPGFKKGVTPLSENMTTDQLLEFTFDKEQLKTINDMFRWNVGKHVEGVMEHRFGLFMGRRRELNRGAQLAFYLYDTVYQYYREKVIKELVNSGDIPVNVTKNGNTLYRYDLTSAQEQLVEQRVRAAMPMVHTPLSKDSKDLGAGLFIGKTERSVAKDADTAYTQKVEFKKRKDKTRYVDGRGMKRQMVDPGIATLIMMIHSSDSAISSYAAEQLQALNIHDAHGLSLNDAAEGGKNLNKATYEVMRDYSAPLEIHEALVRTIRGLKSLGEDLVSDPELRERFVALSQELHKSKLNGLIEPVDDINPDNGDVFRYILKQTERAAFASEYTKLQNMAQSKAYNQYAFEGGEYLVTDADRAKALENLDALDARPANKGDRDLMEVLYSLFPGNEAYSAEIAAEREAKAMDPESLASQEEIAAALDLWLADLSSDAVKELTGNGVIGEALIQKGRNLRYIGHQFSLHGNLNQVLEEYLDGEANDPFSELATFKKELIARLRNYSVSTKDVRSAPASTVSNLIDALNSNSVIQANSELSQDLVLVQQTINSGVYDVVASIEKMLPTERAQQVLATLNRYYNSGREHRFGLLGAPYLSQDSELVAFLEKNPQTTTKELIGAMKSALKKRNKTSGLSQYDRFINQMLNLLSGSLPGDTKVELLTANSETAFGYASMEIVEASAAYLPGVGIMVKNTDFQNASVTYETLTHEMIHAAVVGITRKALQGGTVIRGEELVTEQVVSDETVQLVKELEALHGEAKRFLEEQGGALASRWAYATSNLDEFIAFGMSNQDFQNDVLKKLTVADKGRGNKLIDGMTAFINKLVGILFGKNAPADKRNGLYQMVANTTALMKAAREDAQKTRGMELPKGKPEVIAMQGPDPLEEAKTLTNEQVFDRLAGNALSADRQTHLKELLNSIVEKLHGPMGALGAQLRQEAAYGPEDRYLENLVNGTLPFYSRTLGAELKMTQAEGFVLEQVEMTVREALNSDRAAYEGMAKLFREARTQIRPEDLPAGAHKFIFTPQKQDGESTSDYLSRFAALSLVYKPLNDKMQFATAKTVPSLRGKKLGEIVKTLFARILEILNGKMTNTFAGQQADAKAVSLVRQLVNNEAKYRESAALRKQTLDNAEKGAFQKLSDAAREKATQFAESNPIANNSNVFVRSFGVITSAVANDRVRELFDGLEDVRNKIYAGQRQGIWAAVATEFKGANETNLTAHQLLRIAKHNEQTRKIVKEQIAKGVLESFDPNHKLTDLEKKSLTKVLLRTDMTALLGDGDSGLGTYDLTTLTRMVSDEQFLDSEIKKLEKAIAREQSNTRYYVAQARNTGYFLATGRNASANLMQNAHSIVYLTGTGNKRNKPSFSHAKTLEPMVDRLISLNALKYTDGELRDVAANVMKRELSRGTESGIEMVLKTHERLKREAMDKLFDDGPALFRKGYTKEIYDPYKEVVLAPVSERDDLIKRGYVPGAVLEQDPADPDRHNPKQLFVMHDAGLKSRVTGIYSNTDMRVRGTTIHSGLQSVSGEGLVSVRQDMNTQVAAALNSDIQALFTAPDNYNPERVTGARMAPVVNNMGQIVNYRYMMQEKTKDLLLNRNNALEEILGGMAANIVDKVSSREHNNRAVEAMHQQFREESPLRPHAFVRVSAESEDPTVREAWNLIPEGTKHHIRKVWGRNEMWVRADLYDLHFGYRKLSLTDPWKVAEDERSVQQAMVVATFEAFLGKKAAMRLAKAENIWEELVREVKDIWVIKSVVTLIVNISSNVTELFWFGVNPRNMLRDHREALQGILSYQRDSNEKIQLENMLASGYMTQPPEEIQARLVELEDSINRNPVKELVDAGIFQTIVEDVDAESSDYSYKSRLFRRVQGLTDKLPETVTATGKTLYMAHDTPLYKLMYQGTSLSDFTARYVLYKHLTTRDVEPMAKEEAIQTIVDAFVNYDIPTHKGLQYINDMGIIPFTKYYIRIQKVLMTLYRENPARALAVATFGWFFDSMGVLTDSGIWNKADNPLGNGAFDYIDAVGDIGTIKAAMSIAG